MSDFFHGWRRKAGCVLMFVSLALICAAMRSLVVYDNLTFAVNGQQQMVHLQHGEITWWTWQLNGDKPTRAGIIGAPHTRRKDGRTDLWICSASLATGHTIYGWSIPCWPFTLLIILVSAHLLLWPGKQQERKAKAPEE